MPNKTTKTKVMNENLQRLDWIKFTDLVVSLWSKLPICVTGISGSGNKLNKKTHRELSEFVGISNSHEILTLLQDYIKEHDRIISTVADQIVNAGKDEKKALENAPQWARTLEQRRGTLTRVLLKQCQQLHADTCTRHLFKPDPDKHPAPCVYAFTRDCWLYRKDPQGLADKYALTYSEAVKMMTQAREMSTRKVRALTSAGDRPLRLSPALRPGRADWRLVDDRALTVQDNYISMSSQESVRALTILVSLIDELKVHTNPAAWPDLCRTYEMLGRQCSAIVLQRRWLRLQEMTHFAFLRYADTAAPPHALFLNVARIVPGVVNTRPMSWLEWVRAGHVQRFQEDDCETEEEQLNIAEDSAQETQANEVAVDTSATAVPAAQTESSNSDSDSDVALTIDESCNSELPTTENTAPLIDSIALLKTMDPCTVRSMIIFESDDEEDVLKEVERKEKEETNCDKIDNEKVETVVENAPCLGGVKESNGNEDLAKKEGLVEGSPSSRASIIFENDVVADKNDDSPPQSTVVYDDTADDALQATVESDDALQTTVESDDTGDDALKTTVESDDTGDDALQTTVESDDTGDDALKTTVESDDTGDDALQTTVESDDTGDDALQTTGESDDAGDDALQTTGENDDTGDDALKTTGESDDTGDDALQTTVESDDTTVSKDTNQGAKEPELNKHPTKDDETNNTKDDKCETHGPRDEIESSDGEDFHLHYSTDTDTEDNDNSREEKDEEHETYERKYITTQLKNNPDFNKELNDQNLLNLECNKALMKLCVPVTVDLIRIDHVSISKNVETSNNTNFTFLASKSKPSSTQHRYSTRSSLRSRNNQKKSRNQKDIPNAPKTTPVRKLYSPAKKKASFENDTNDLDSEAENQVLKRKETFSRLRNKINKRIRKRKYSTDSEADNEMTKVRREDFDSGSKIRSRSSESSKKQEQEPPTRPFYSTGKDNNETVASPQPMEVDPEIDQDLSRPIEANTQIGQTTTIQIGNKEGTNTDSIAIEAGPSSSTSRSGPVQTSEPDLESSRKKVVLTDIDSVRRNNRSLRTALVAPMAALKDNDSQPEPEMTIIDLTDTTTADLNPPEASAESDAAADLKAAKRAVLTDAQVLQMIDDIRRTTQVDLQQASLLPSPARGRGWGRGGARGGAGRGARGGSWWSLKWRSLRSVRKITEQIENKLTKATVRIKVLPQKYRKKKQHTFPSPPTADDGLDEWIRQKNINNQYFHFQPHIQNNTQPHTSNTQVPNTQNNGNTSNADSEALNTTERTNVLDSPSTSNQTSNTTQSNEEIASELTTSEVNTSSNETQKVTLNMNDVVPQNESSASSGQVESSKPNKPRRIKIVLQDFVHQDPPLVNQSVENRSSNETQRLTLNMNDTVQQNQPASSDQSSSSNETQRLTQTLNDIVLQNRPSDSNQKFENSSANLHPRYEIRIKRNTVITSLLNKPSTLPPINTNSRSLLIDNCKIMQTANNEVSPESTNVRSPDKITVTPRAIPPTPVIKSKLIVLDASKINAKCRRQSNLNNDNNSAQNIKDNHSESTQTNSNLKNDNNSAQNKMDNNLSAQTNADAIEISDDDDNSAIDEPTRWPMRVKSGKSCIRYYQNTKTPAIKATTETNNPNKLKDKIVLNNRVLVPNDAGVYDFVDNLKPQTSTKDSLSNIIITDVRSQNLTRYVPNTQLKAVIDSEVSHATPTDQESLATNPPQQFQTNNPASSFQTNNPASSFQTNNPVPSFQSNNPVSSFQSNNPVSSFQTTNPTAQFQATNPIQPYQTQFSIVPQTNLNFNNVTQTSLNMSNLANNPEIATLTPNNMMPSINMPQTSFQGNMNTQNNSTVTQPTVNVVITPNIQSPFANNTNPIIRNVPIKAFANMPANANFGPGLKRITNACKHPILFMPEGASTPILIQPGMTAEQPLTQLNQFPFTSM